MIQLESLTLGYGQQILLDRGVGQLGRGRVDRLAGT